LGEGGRTREKIFGLKAMIFTVRYLEDLPLGKYEIYLA